MEWDNSAQPVHCHQLTTTKAPLPTDHCQVVAGQLNKINSPRGQHTVGGWRKSWVSERAGRQNAEQKQQLEASHFHIPRCCHCYAKLWAIQSSGSLVWQCLRHLVAVAVGRLGQWGGGGSWARPIFTPGGRGRGYENETHQPPPCHPSHPLRNGLNSEQHRPRQAISSISSSGVCENGKPWPPRLPSPLCILPTPAYLPAWFSLWQPTTGCPQGELAVLSCPTATWRQ